MSIGLTDDHRDLRDAVRAFAERHVTPEAVRAAIDADGERRPGFWPALADQGLLGLHLPEADGGSGYGLLEAAVVLEELCRHLTPGAVLPTVLAGAVLDAAGHRPHLAALADGTLTGAVALESELRGVPDGDGLRITGAAETVLGGALADVLVLPVRDGEATRVVVLPRAALVVTELPSHDPTRRLARVEAADVPCPAGDVLAVEHRLVRDLAAALLAAEASGSADRSTGLAAEHARMRVQFGRPIGQFQAVKHRVARMLVRAEQARACAWDAVRAHDGLERTGGDQASLAAAVAGSLAVDAAVTAAHDCIATLGGIGFTWEHDIGFHLRRAQTARVLLGPSAHWRERVGRLAAAGVRRGRDLDLPPELADARRVIAEELAPAVAMPEPERRRYLADRGYTAPHLPEPWGRAADPLTQLAIAEELARLELRPHQMMIGNWVVPTLIAHGTAAQHERFLAPTLRGDLEWCQLFSEPGAGSDLASLTTRAEKVEGGWRVRGQKVWTSRATEAHFGILLARTDPDAPRHRGLSYFLVDMASPGIDVRPLRELTGEARFSEVFLDDVLVPDDCLVGRPGEGWRLARTTLANERVAMTSGSGLSDGEEALARMVDPDDPGRLADLGEILADAQALSLLTLRQTLRSLAGLAPGPESSIAKLLTGEHVQRVWETVLEWDGPAALVARPEEHGAAWHALHSRSYTIAGGTTDVQLSIIAERMLGLPRDPAA